MLKVVVVTLCHRSWKSVDIQAFLSMYECMLIVMNISIWGVLQLQKKKTALSYRQSLQGLAYITVHGLEKNI